MQGFNFIYLVSLWLSLFYCWSTALGPFYWGSEWRRDNYYRHKDNDCCCHEYERESLPRYHFCHYPSCNLTTVDTIDSKVLSRWQAYDLNVTARCGSIWIIKSIDHLSMLNLPTAQHFILFFSFIRQVMRAASRSLAPSSEWGCRRSSPSARRWRSTR